MTGTMNPQSLGISGEDSKFTRACLPALVPATFWPLARCCPNMATFSSKSSSTTIKWRWLSSMSFETGQCQYLRVKKNASQVEQLMVSSLGSPAMLRRRVRPFHGRCTAFLSPRPISHPSRDPEFDPYNDYPTISSTTQLGDFKSPALNVSCGAQYSHAHATTLRPPIVSIRSSVPLLPTPGTESQRNPTYEPLVLRFWFVTLGCVFLGALGVSLEVARVISNDNDGFHVKQKNVFSFASVQFLTSFFPSLLFVPLAIMIRGFDGGIRMWNPYLLLSRGHASADETLLLDYVGDSRPVITYNALRFKHRFVLVSGFTALTALLFQPLAGSVFSIKQLPKGSPATAQNIRAVGLSPDIADLTSFAASAGFAEAAVFNSIGDPSFIMSCWAIAEFVFPTSNSYLNGTMSINTTGIQTLVNCANPNQLSLTSSDAYTSTISATSVDGCTLQVSLNPNDSEQQYGVTNVPNCGPNKTHVEFEPVFFWFINQNNTAGVFCQPTILLYDVIAFASLNNNSLTNVTIVDNYPQANNVSGAPLNGFPYNGLIFGASTDFNIQARATSIKSGIPNAIFRQAQQAPGGLSSVFADPDGFLTYTDNIYTQHLALATKSNYFIPQNKTVNAVLTQLVPRLYVEPVPAHLLATLCMGVASVVLGLHYVHFRRRRDIYLAHPPGSIASAMALTAHSGFGEVLLPYDNAETFSRAYASLRFCLDRRTGAIVVDDSMVAYAGDLPAQAVRDETMTLISKDRPAPLKMARS